jgi:hypothetical protein
MILPEHLISSPKNPLMLELKTLSSFADPVNISSESSRELFYQNASLFNSSLIHNFLTKINHNITGLPINTNALTNYLLGYFTGVFNVNNLSNDTELLKNQYRPMKKGVSNMIKLHATGAVAMPIETRLHILASSKDVIHS